MLRTGTLRASHESARKAFSRGRKVQVFPGGNLEAFRSYKERNRIVFGNRRGFVKLAIREQVPIIPAVFVGGHEGTTEDAGACEEGCDDELVRLGGKLARCSVRT